jgi:hypothetical protein
MPARPVAKVPPQAVHDPSREVGMTLSPAVRAFLDGLALIIARDIQRHRHSRPASPPGPVDRSS